MQRRVAIWSFSIFNTKNAQKYRNFYLATQMEHDQFSYFCRGPDDFCWGPAPVGPTLVTGQNTINATICSQSTGKEPHKENNRKPPCFFYATRFVFCFPFFHFCAVPSWLFRQLLSASKSTVSYRKTLFFTIR